MTTRKAAVLCLLLSAINLRAIDDTVTIVDGYSTNIGSFITSGTNNLLIITNGGVATLDAFAPQSDARTNAVIVTGVGSRIATPGTLGTGGRSNTLQFLNGGTRTGRLNLAGSNNFIFAENTALTNATITFGGTSNLLALKNTSLPGATLNIASSSSQIDLDGSTLTDSATTFNFNSRNSRITFGNGSVRKGNSLTMDGASNRLEVIGPGSVWVNTNLVSIGGSSPRGSTFRVADGATAEAFGNLDVGISTAFNELIIEGAGSTASVVKILNFGGGNSNRLYVLAGGTLLTDNATISGRSNTAVISGNASIWSNRLTVSFSGSSNRLELTDGASFSATSFSSSGASNVVSLTAGSRFLLSSNLHIAAQLRLLGGGDVEVDNLKTTGGVGNRVDVEGGTHVLARTDIALTGSGSSLILSEAAKMQSPRLEFGYVLFGSERGTNGHLQLTGPGTELSASSMIVSSRWQRVTIGSGAVLRNDNVNFQRGDFSLQLVGEGSEWSIAGPFETASAGVNDSLILRGGSTLSNANSVVGHVAPLSQIFPSGPIRTLVSANVEQGSRWLAASNLWIGLNANNNSFTVLEGGFVAAQNFGLGVFFRSPSTAPSGPIGGENTFLIDGPTSRMVVTNEIYVGSGTWSNRFTISNGASVEGGIFFANRARPEIQSFFANWLPARSNVVEILGTNSQLVLSSNYLSGSSGHFVMTNGARLIATGVSPGGYVTIGGGSAVEAGDFFQFSGLKFLLENSTLNAKRMDFGWVYGEGHMRITGRETKVGAEELYLKHSFPLQGPAQGFEVLEILDSASVTSRWIVIGANAAAAPPLMKVNGGFVYALTLEKSGLLQIDHGALDVQSGIVRADKLQLSTTNAVVTVAGDFAVAKGFAGGSGELRIGDISAEVLLHGRVIANTASLGPNAIVKFVADDSALPAAITANSIHLDGTLVVILAHDHRLNPGDTVVLGSAPTITGAFDNVAFGERIVTSNGTGTFLLKYEDGKLLLSDFQEFHLNAAFDGSASTITLSFPSSFTPQIETSTNLLDWLAVASPQIETSGAQSQWTAPVDRNEPTRFYRLAR